MKCYRTIVADPPWEFGWRGGSGGHRRNSTGMGYLTLCYAEIRDMDIPWLAEPYTARDATLFLWLTREALHEGWGAHTAREWGFPQRVGEFIWHKPNFGTGDFPRIGHETCAIYKRGKGSLRPDRPRNVHSVQTWSQPRASNNGGKIHSAKPLGLSDLVEQGHVGPYLELFARRERMGWDSWGDQSLNTAGLVA